MLERATGLAIWDVARGRLLSKLTGDPHGTELVAFSSDGNLLAALGPSSDHEGPQSVRLWDMRIESRDSAEVARLVEQWMPKDVSETVVQTFD